VRVAYGKPQKTIDLFARWNLPPMPGKKEEVKPVQPKFKAGMHVRHESWGEGLVVDVRIQDNEERVDVFFDSVGFKRLLASLAKLEIVKK